jgi:translation initiation factor 2B subunit (eIF-2B alpha/beta/delta family)
MQEELNTLLEEALQIPALPSSPQEDELQYQEALSLLYRSLFAIEGYAVRNNKPACIEACLRSRQLFDTALERKPLPTHLDSALSDLYKNVFKTENGEISLSSIKSTVGALVESYSSKEADKKNLTDTLSYSMKKLGELLQDGTTTLQASHVLFSSE